MFPCAVAGPDKMHSAEHDGAQYIMLRRSWRIPRFRVPVQTGSALVNLQLSLVTRHLSLVTQKIDRKPVDSTALSLMVMCCFIWAFNHVAAKLAAPDMSLVMQGGVRSAIAAACLLVWARMRGIPLFQRDGTFWPGLAAGAGIYLVNVRR